MKRVFFVLIGFFSALCSGAQVSMGKILTADSGARRHEVHLNPTIVISPVLTGRLPALHGADLTYSRVYGGTHRLRVGLSYYRTSHTHHSEVNYQWTDDSSTTRMKISRRRSDGFFARLGYEVSLGKRKTRYLLGADLYGGYRRESYGEYYGTFLLNTVTERYKYDIFMVGIKPRAAVRYEFSELFAGGLALGLWVGGQAYLPYTKETYVEKDPLPELIKSEKLTMGGFGLVLGYLPEINLIFKIPGKKIR